MTKLIDSSVLIDTLNDRNGRPQLLSDLSNQGILLACCPINVTEVYMGMLEFYSVTWDIAQLAGDLFRRWRHKGQTLALSDLTIAAVAITRKLVLVTDNQKHFPMPEIELFAFPSITTS